MQVTAVVGMENSSKSMRCFLKATGGSPFIQFSKSSENGDDTGDGGGAPVFTYFSISAFGMLIIVNSAMRVLNLNVNNSMC